MRAEDINTQEDIRLWAVKHEAETKACRGRHEERISAVEATMEVIRKRLERIETRLAVIVAIAALVGSLAPTVLERLLRI